MVERIFIPRSSVLKSQVGVAAEEYLPFLEIRVGVWKTNIKLD